MAGMSWETGKEITGVTVNLGSQELSSGCRVVLSDPGHVIAERLIRHSLASGGIQTLEASEGSQATTNKQQKPNKPTDDMLGNVGTDTSGGTVSKGGIFTPSVRAFLDTCAKRETSDPLGLVGYYQNNGLGSSQGQFTDLDIRAGGGFPKSAGTVYNVGRYQFNRADWQDAVKAGYLKTGYSPKEQDLVALYKVQRQNKGWKELQAGDISAAIYKARIEWASMPGSPYGQVQSGTSAKEFLDYYQTRLAVYEGRKAPLVKEKPVTLTKPTAAGTPQVTQETPQESPGVIKGSLMAINIEGLNFDFYHQGTECSQEGQTILVGQGVRWLMSRRKRSTVFKDLRLSDLARTVSTSYRLKLDYQATYDPEYSHVDQSGLSDYKLLYREVEASGLLITESGDTLVIKERKQLVGSQLVLRRGSNLISYQITDRALSGNNDDDISKFLAQESKTAINPITGKVVKLITDVERNNTRASVTGTTQVRKTGTLKAGTTQQTKERARTKRVGGLPSTFVLPMTLQSLELVPLGTCVTEDFPGILNRIWVIKDVKHDLGQNETTLQLVSPVEVPDDLGATKVTKETVGVNPRPRVDQDTSEAGSLNQRIYRAAMALRGYSTKDSPVGATVACAWVVNRVVFKIAGVRIIGSNPDLVDSVRSAMDAGRGIVIPKGQEQKGDVLILGSGQRAHIGIRIDGGLILSNSSSRASFSWIAGYQAYVDYYGSGTYYRVIVP